MWILGGFTPRRTQAVNPQKLYRINYREDYQIDMAEEKLVPNVSEAVWVPLAKSINKEGELILLGKMTLEFPDVN